LSVQNNTPPPPNVELKFQMHSMTKMMERMNLMMGNVCDRLEKVGKHGNVAGTYTQEVRKVEAQHKSNNGSGLKGQGAAGKVFGSLETKGISCILMRCHGKRKGGFKRRGGIKWREIKRLVF